jgi:transcriptional regulator with XRE-family HTH domain
MGKEPNRIREIRLAQRMSQGELAELVGCSTMQISGLERGKPKLDQHWMARVADALRVAPGDLLLPHENPKAARDDQELAWLELFRNTPPEHRAQLLQVGESVAGFAHQPVNKSAA